MKAYFQTKKCSLCIHVIKCIPKVEPVSLFFFETGSVPRTDIQNLVIPTDTSQGRIIRMTVDAL